MPENHSRSLARLVQPDRVHRSLYTDPAIFALEMERIFERTWIYVGHESQVKNPGDFVATRIGTKPVLMSRHTEGRVYVLHNQCAHRGAQVVADASGNAPEFR
jgi:phenylpropionate dioxygenase-like ring-hydroxylating dioxygenase large terminal subunit